MSVDCISRGPNVRAVCHRGCITAETASVWQVALTWIDWSLFETCPLINTSHLRVQVFKGRPECLMRYTNGATAPFQLQEIQRFGQVLRESLLEMEKCPSLHSHTHSYIYIGALQCL